MALKKIEPENLLSPTGSIRPSSESVQRGRTMYDRLRDEWECQHPGQEFPTEVHLKLWEEVDKVIGR